MKKVLSSSIYLCNNQSTISLSIYQSIYLFPAFACVSPTATVTFLLVAAVQTVGVSVAAPANGDAVAVFALILVIVALDIAAVLEAREEQLELPDVPESSRWLRE